MLRKCWLFPPRLLTWTVELATEATMLSAVAGAVIESRCPLGNGLHSLPMGMRLEDGPQLQATSTP